ncbi:hypothetical protein LguiB_000516 [Lonicera macranthoides]
MARRVYIDGVFSVCRISSTMEVGKQGRIYRLRCWMQNYDWGRIVSESTVAKLFSLNSKVEIEEEKPYAEI